MSRALSGLAVCLAALASACSDGEETTPYSYRVPEQVDDGWETAALDRSTVDVARLGSLVDAARSEIYLLHSILIAQGGRLVFEEYFPGHESADERGLGRVVDFDRGTRHEAQSASKSFRSALLGIAIDQGFVNGVHEPILSFFPELADLGVEGKERIELWHMLTMSSGLDWPETSYGFPDSRNPLWQLYQLPSAAWPRFIFERPVAHPPGSVWNYNSGLTFLIRDVIASTTGMSAVAFADRFLFERMQSGPGGGFPFSDGVLPRDMAKLGQVFLDRGRWKGTRVVSEAWVRDSTTPYFLTPWGSFPSGYGYLWYRRSFPLADGDVEAFYAHGHGGQSIWVFESLDLVLVFTAGYFGQSDPTFDWVEQYVLPAFG